MKIDVSLVGLPLFKPRPEVEWPEGWPVPPLGAEITLPIDGKDTYLYVRAVEWYPAGSPDEEIGDPFIHLVLGPNK